MRGMETNRGPARIEPTDLAALERYARTIERQQRDARARQRKRRRASMLGWIGAAVLGHRMPGAASLLVDAEWRRDALDAYCWRCGVSRTPFEDLANGCALCRDRRTPSRCPKLHGVVRLGRYAPPLSQWVPAIKQHAWRDMGLTLGHELGLQVAEAIGLGRIPRPDIVVPVPIHWLRRTLRGIDHAGLLAEEVARVVGVPCVRLLRARLASRQHGSGRGGRLANSGRFHATDLPRGATVREVLLIDDVRTTGGTTLEAARALRTKGVQGVAVAVCAVADPPSRATLAAAVSVLGTGRT